MTSDPTPSFSPGRKWNRSLQLVISLLAVIALVVMVNYLAARHSVRWPWSRNAQAELSPRTQRVLAGVTNTVKVILYFDKRDPLYEMSWNLLKIYRYANDRIQLETVDYNIDPGAAEVVKAAYKLGQTDRDLVLFECQGNRKSIYQGELSEIDIQPLLRGESGELRRTHFKGEAAFTAAIFNVTSGRSAKAYFLEGHKEHNPDSDDASMGYSKFADVLQENNVRFERLNLAGAGEVPADCQLLIIAGPQTALPQEVLDRIDRYLKRGGRLLALFSSPISTPRPTGLETTLADWGVAVGRTVVRDTKNYVSANQLDLVSATYGSHPVTRPLFGAQLYLVHPRAVSKDAAGPVGADAPQVDPLLYTSPAGHVYSDIRPDGSIHPAAADFIGAVPLIVAVEKGGIRNVRADRGATRLVVTGDSLFLSNNHLDREGNRIFASQVINWLLARDELLVGIAPQPISEYKLTMTASQMTAAQFILMAAFPGAALALGALVWLRRRR